MARWASFFAEVPLEGSRWANFFAETRLEGRAGRVCGPAVVGSRASFDAARSRQLGPSTGTLNPSMRSYTHIVVAGRGRPTGPSNPPRNAKR